MRIGAINGSPAAPRRAARAGAFTLPDEAPTAATTAAAPAASLLTLQDTAAVTPDPARARRRASAALDDLRGLQLELLDGTMDPARLARLAALTEGLEAAVDPALRDVLGAVALRARLELARRRASSTSRP
jgi:hypothetical protein